MILNCVRERGLWKEGSLFTRSMIKEGITAIPFIGIHPWDTAEADSMTLQELEALSDETGAFIGEIGLDRLRGAEREKQVSIFRSALDIAFRKEKPFTIHCVREWGMLAEILEGSRERIKTPFIVHAWSGSAEVMKRIISLGGYISFGTGRGGSFSDKAKTCLTRIDRKFLLLETDFTCKPISMESDNAIDSNDPLDPPGTREKWLPGSSRPEGHPGMRYLIELYSVYRAAARVLGCDMEDLSGAVEENGEIFKTYAASRQ